MSPLAEPLLSRLRRSEFTHFFPIELQNAGVFMPHHLQEGISGLFRAGARRQYRQVQKEKGAFKS